MENKKIAYRKKPRPCVGESLALKMLADRKGVVVAAELVGYSTSAISDYLSGKIRVLSASTRPPSSSCLAKTAPRTALVTRLSPFVATSARCSRP